MEEIKYIAKHNCIGIEYQGNVAVDMCEIDDDTGWFLHLFLGNNEQEKLVSILHCPYCGKQLAGCL